MCRETGNFALKHTCVRSSNNEEAGATPHVKVLTANPSKPQDIRNLLSWSLKEVKNQTDLYLHLTKEQYKTQRY